VAAAELVAIVTRRTLRCTPGPQAACFPPEAVERFHATSWEISESADRSGLRLIGPALPLPGKGATQTEGVCAGSVQVPGDGRPIVLFTDQQTTGGYPKIATVIAADLPAVGQLRPRDRIRFERVGLAAARELLLAQERLLEQALPPA
jgi:allophanate hydrolase subunit 2